MVKIKRSLVGLAIAGLFASLSTFGADYFYCSKTSSYVHVGDSIDLIDSVCDKPSRIEKIPSQQKITSTPVEQWIYNFQPNSGFRKDLGEATEVNFQKNALLVNFDGEYISQIFINWKKVYQTNFCRPDLSFGIGDTRQTVIQYCAKPSIMRNAMEENVINTHEQIIYTYQTDPYSPTTLLTFENNKLISISSGNPSSS